MTDHNENKSTPSNEDGIPWKGIAIGGVFLLALFVAAPFIQIWIDSIPRYEERPSMPLAAHMLTGDQGIIRLPSDGRFVAAAPVQEDYVHYFKLHELRLHSEDPAEVAKAVAELERIFDEEKLLKLMSEAELLIIDADPFIAQVKVTSGRHEGAEVWLSSEFVKKPR